MLNSIPWALKGVLLCVNLYMQAQIEPTPMQARRVILVLAVEVILLLSTTAPSLLFSVADRARTNTHVTALAFYLLNAYAVACLLLREPHLHALLHVALQFALLHLHYWQAHELRRMPKLMLFGSVWTALHATGALLLPAALASSGPPPAPLHPAHVALALFAGEVLGFVATVQSKFLRACGEAYESAVS
jgi:hypothetical protein